MRKLPLIFRDDWQLKEKEIEGLFRQFHTIILDKLVIHDTKLAGIMEKVGGHTRHLEMEKVRVENRSLSDILSGMKILEKVSLLSCKLKECGIQPCTLEQLKSLVLFKTDWDFLNLFCNTQVRELKIGSQDSNDKSTASIISFLEKQEKLVALAVCSLSGDIFKTLASASPKNLFKLKKLAVVYKFWGNDSTTDDAFITLLKHHQPTLEDLETHRRLSPAIIEFVMKKLKLKRLMIEGDQLPTKPLFYNAMRSNIYLKSLVITTKLDNIDSARGLLYIYQHIESLIITSWSTQIINDIIIFIANTCKKLRYLEIPSLTADTPELAITSLKTLHVDFVDNVAEWEHFCVSNPSIENITVKWLGNQDAFSYEIINRVTQGMPNLQHIKFGAYFRPTARILEMMSRNCQSLKLLEVFADDPNAFRSNSTMNARTFKVSFYPNDAVTFVFKEEPSMWDESEIDQVFSDNEMPEYADGDDELSGDDDDLSGEEEYEDMEAGWDDAYQDDFNFNPLFYYQQ